MTDPVSLAAISGVLGAIGMGMANEVGRAAWETTGALVRRAAGREVPAPRRSAEVARVAALLREGAERDPELARMWERFASTLPTGPGLGSVGTPRLPAATRHFTDRRPALRLLDREADRRFDGRPRVALLYGPEGIGTTATALHWGSRRAEDFPDGQVHADLHGWSSRSARGPGVVAGRLLRDLGLPAEATPHAADERLDLWRRLVADLRLLVVLDHTYSAAQVRPLLTSAPGVCTLVTARHPLPGLDAVPVALGPLAARDARRLLSHFAGTEAVAAAPEVAKDLLVRCAGSPYALRTAAPLLTAHGGAGPGGTAADGTGAGAAGAAEPVAALTESAYRALDTDAARLYRLLALRDWPHVDARTAAWATQQDPDPDPDPDRAPALDTDPVPDPGPVPDLDPGPGPAPAAALLGLLADRGLLEPVGPGSDRYRFRPAVRRHAELLARHEDGPRACAESISRVVRGYAGLAEDAARQALPESWRVPQPSRPGPPVSKAEALGVLVREAANLSEAVQAAADAGDRAAAVRLGRSLWPLQLKAGRHAEAVPALRTVIRLLAADPRPSAADLRDRAALRFQLAMSLTELGEHGEAETAFRAAAEDERAAGHIRGRASVAEALGLLRLRQWEWPEALAFFDEAQALYGTIAPGTEGHADLPRALPLLQRHRGRALRGAGRFEEAGALLRTAVASFEDIGDDYNRARALTDLAETHVLAAAPAEALPLVEEAIALLDAQRAEYPLAYARSVRARCVTP
ncbi:tetratricopeptide repeat protein [Streptomyces sp. WMMC500]|uniref:tetratricopeptide repeat protein n=1 Tax=Streptomyces sp. WMMC500 TaxID=3015154 RepID=UPI00248CB932|nr:tetratricopeptide repeat protein [Streptomyces sp. WMMC500]WBB58207.1 tetratricopeptide repeat protein [Streptomyces sp. WMMC500]